MPWASHLDVLDTFLGESFFFGEVEMPLVESHLAYTETKSEDQLMQYPNILIVIYYCKVSFRFKINIKKFCER